MTTAFLRSQNCFRNRNRYQPESLTLSNQSRSGGKSRTGYVSSHESGARRRNRSLAGFRSGEGRSWSRSRTAEAENPARNLVMGKVKILRRGETLTSLKTAVDCDGDGDGESKQREVNHAEDLDLLLGSTDRLGPDADTVQEQISFRNRLAPDGSAFSGSGFSFSPSPNSLPIPGFLARGN